jgi:hypothetical protein
LSHHLKQPAEYPYRFDFRTYATSPPTITIIDAYTAYDIRLHRHRNIAMSELNAAPSSLTQKSLSNLSLPPPEVLLTASPTAYLIHRSTPKNHPHHALLGNCKSASESLANSLSSNTHFTPIHAACVGSSTASQHAEPCSGKQPILDAFVITAIFPRQSTSIRWPHGRIVGHLL